MSKGSISGVLGDQPQRGTRGTGKTPPRTYIQLYKNPADATYPEMLSEGESEASVVAELLGTVSPGGMKYALLALRNGIRDGTIVISNAE